MLSGLLVATLAGCAAIVGPDPDDRPRVAAPAAFAERHGGDPSLVPPTVATTPTTRERWAALTDDTLRHLLVMADAGSPDLSAATLRVAQARAAESMTAAQRGPQAGLRASASGQRQSASGASSRLVDAIGGPNRDQLIAVLSDPFALWQAGFDASWEPDLWGRVRRSLQAAQAQQEEAAALLVQVRLALAADVVRQYHQLRGLQAQRRALALQRAAAAEAERLLAAQQRGGLADEAPLIARRARLQDLAGADQTLRLEEAATLNRLSLLCGQPPGTLNALVAADPGAAAPAVAWAPDTIAPLAAPALPDLAPGVPADLARHRPDLRAAEARLAQATAQVGVAVADLYPRITLGASFGFESVHVRRFGEWGTRQWSVGPSLSLPLFDQGRRRAAITLRELQQQEAAVAFQQTVLRAWHDVDDALSAYASDLAQRRTQAGRAALADQALALARARWRRGATDYLPVLDGELAAADARRLLAELDARLRVRLVAIYKSLGDDGSLRLGEPPRQLALQGRPEHPPTSTPDPTATPQQGPQPEPHPEQQAPR